MYSVETLPQQAEHFEWLYAIDFFHNYLDIIKERVVDLANREGEELDNITQGITNISDTKGNISI